MCNRVSRQAESCFDIETALPIYSAIVGEVKFYDKIKI